MFLLSKLLLIDTFLAFCDHDLLSSEFSFTLKSNFVVVVLQPGPRDFLLQCFIKRNRATQTYFLYLGLTNGEHLLFPYVY